MHSSLQPNQTSPYIQELLTFENLCYPFKNTSQQALPLLKTSIELNPSQANQQISILTKISHQNIVNLKKIGKSKKGSTIKTHLYWLYYQNVPYAIKDRKVVISAQKLRETLKVIFQYLQSQKVGVRFRKENIGISSEDEIKVYIPAQDIIQSKKDLSPTKLLQQIEEIANWYQKTFLNEKELCDQKKPKNKRLQNIDTQLQNIRKKIKSVETKYQIDSQSLHPSKLKDSEVNHNKLNQFQQFKEKEQQERIKKQQKIQQNINCINIFHNTNQIVNPNKFYSKEFDNDSVDTYQLEMGEDYQMPSIKTNQRLRQTIFTNKNPWDTMTTKAPSKNKNIHESAGNKVFHRIIEENKLRLENQNKKSSDSQTVNEKTKNKNCNWPSETFRSDNSPNIQQRVQQALAKTKNVMSMLKNNTKSFSLQK